MVRPHNETQQATGPRSALCRLSFWQCLGFAPQAGLVPRVPPPCGLWLAARAASPASCCALPPATSRSQSIVFEAPHPRVATLRVTARSPASCSRPPPVSTSIAAHHSVRFLPCLWHRLPSNMVWSSIHARDRRQDPGSRDKRTGPDFGRAQGAGGRVETERSHEVARPVPHHHLPLDGLAASL